MEYSTTKSAIKRKLNSIRAIKLSPKTCMCTTIHRVLENVFDYQREQDSLYSTKRVPEDRRLTKINQAANLDESSASESTDETYHRYPESDHSATHGEERLSDKTSLTGKSNNKETEKLRSSLKKSTRGNAGKLRDQANEKHVEMCSTAMKVMGRLKKFLDKYEDSDDTE